jgi:hypothetical protein
MYNIDFTEYDWTFSKNAVILEKCSFRDNVTIRFSYGMINLLVKSMLTRALQHQVFPCVVNIKVVILESSAVIIMKE